jgi:uncharacterized membrane protein
MKISLIALGVIFLVLGTMLYFVPMQEFKAKTTTIGNGNVDNRTSSANIIIPIVYAYASTAIGLILTILGFVIPSSNGRRNDPKKNSYYNKVIESKENIELGRGNNRKIIREKTERQSSGRNKNDK